MVEQLASESSVEKKVDPADRRSQLVSITNQGRQAVRQDQRTRREWIAALLAGCTVAEKDKIIGAITVLEKVLDKAS